MRYKYIHIALSLVLIMFITSCKKAQHNDNIDEFNTNAPYPIDEPVDSTSDGSFSLTDYDTPPTPIQNPMPVYPLKYKKSGIQGVVVLDVEVLADGTVGEVKVMKSLLSDVGAMDDVAINAVKAWIFKPALLDKKPVTAHVNIPIPFSLKNH